MATKIFVDTNIFIDLFDNKRANHQDAIVLFEQLENGSCTGFVTECVLNTTAYLVRKDYAADKLKLMFQHLLYFIQLIPVSNSIYNNALNFNSPDIENAVLYAAAIDAKLNYFITSNHKDFKKMEIASLPILSLKEFIANYL
jgi:predicted nucleic acid-binding protein